MIKELNITIVVTKLTLYDARNKAIEKTSGELIAFLDVDDWWDKNYLSSRKYLFNEERIDFFIVMHLFTMKKIIN